MPDTLQLAIDPYLLCLPNPCTSLEQIEGFVNAILGWSDLLRRHEVCVLVSDSARIALIDDGEYPYQHRMRELLRTYNCDVADHETVCRVAQNLIDRTPSLEDSFGVKAILVDESKTKIEPSLIIKRLKSKSRSALIEMLVIISVTKTASSSEYHSSAVVASAFDDTTGNVDIILESELHDWEWSDENSHSALNLPYVIQDTIPVASSHNALMQQLGVWIVWENATREGAAIGAIELCISEIMEDGVDGSGRALFRLGPHFLESARTWGFGSRSDYAMLLAQSCARIVLGIPKNPLNEFYVNHKPNKQRIRNDGACAYRTHLTKKGAGFRLMIWKLPDGTIEFANVGDKDELEIL